MVFSMFFFFIVFYEPANLHLISNNLYFSDLNLLNPCHFVIFVFNSFFQYLIGYF